MSRTTSTFLPFLTCLLIGSTYALIGQNVKSVGADKYHFVVSISHRYEGDRFQHQHICTGSIISHTRIVTAAHCLVNRHPNLVEIIAGSRSLKRGRKYYPESWTLYEEWSQHHGGRFSRSDIAVIRLQGEGITEIRPVEFLSFNSVHSDNREFIITGWGESERGNPITSLRKGKVDIISNEECAEKGSELQGKRFVVPENYFCSKADPYVLSTCGDGGAPILNKEEKLVGITRGACPNLEGYLYNSDEFLNQNLMNAHLAVFPYLDFIHHA